MGMQNNYFFFAFQCPVQEKAIRRLHAGSQATTAGTATPCAPREFVNATQGTTQEKDSAVSIPDLLTFGTPIFSTFNSVGACSQT